jgi:GNAT superfamily N-acetyltransferase
MLMARNHETIVGCCGLSDDIQPDLMLVDLLVHPGFRKHGIGTLLVKAAHERTRDHRFIIPTRSHNVAFYRKAGFRKLLHHEKPQIITNGYVIWMG